MLNTDQQLCPKLINTFRSACANDNNNNNIIIFYDKILSTLYGNLMNCPTCVSRNIVKLILPLGIDENALCMCMCMYNNNNNATQIIYRYMYIIYV